MRRALLIGSFLVLVAALYGLWVLRFERVPDARTWTLADLRAGAPHVPVGMWGDDQGNTLFRLKLDDGSPKVAVRLGIPGISPLRFVHIGFRMSSKNLKPGTQEWEDGRFLLQWHVPGLEYYPETEYIASIRGREDGALRNVVIDSESGPAVPALCLEHLGRSGGFELADLEITPVRERKLWAVGKWFLAAAWLFWGAAWMRSWPGVSKWRAVAASCVGLAIGFSLIVPGPWDRIHPLGGAFQLGARTTGGEAALAKHETGGIVSAMIPPSGKLEEKGSLLLRIKLRISQARPLLHALLWAGSSMALALLVGRRPAIWMSAMLALGMELAQLAFGFGSDWVDLLDLASDATGIALAMWLYTRWIVTRDGRSSSRRESS